MKYFISSLALACLLIASPSWAAVSFDAATASQNAGSDTTDSFSHTIGSGSNVYVGVCVVTRKGGTNTITVSSLTINGGAATFRGASDGNGSSFIRVEYWDRVLGSTTGSVTIAPTVSEGDAFRTTAFSLFGVDQTTPTGTLVSAPTVAATTISATVSAATNDLVMGCLGTATAATSLTAGTGETQRWSNIVDNNGTYELGVSEPGAASVTIAPTWTNTEYGNMVAIPVKQASSTPIAQTLMLMGVGN